MGGARDGDGRRGRIVRLQTRLVVPGLADLVGDEPEPPLRIKQLEAEDLADALRAFDEGEALRRGFGAGCDGGDVGQVLRKVVRPAERRGLGVFADHAIDRRSCDPIGAGSQQEGGGGYYDGDDQIRSGLAEAHGMGSLDCEGPAASIRNRETLP